MVLYLAVYWLDITVLFRVDWAFHSTEMTARNDGK